MKNTGYLAGLLVQGANVHGFFEVRGCLLDIIMIDTLHLRRSEGRKSRPRQLFN